MSFRKFKEGVSLESTSTPPSNPIIGTLWFSSGAGSYVEGLWVYKADTLWHQAGGAGGINAWVASSTYNTGDVIYFTDNKMYRCTTANSDATFTASKWQLLSVEMTNIYQSGSTFTAVVSTNNLVPLSSQNVTATLPLSSGLTSGSGSVRFETFGNYNTAFRLSIKPGSGDTVTINGTTYSNTDSVQLLPTETWVEFNWDSTNNTWRNMNPSSFVAGTFAGNLEVTGNMIVDGNLTVLGGTTGISGSNSGFKNYVGVITTSNGNNNINGNAEGGTTTGWSVKNTTLTSLIPTGTPTGGASANLSITAASSNPLSGSYSLNLASSTGTSVAGDCLISNAFYIDNEDKSRMMSISFNYKAVSGTFNFSGTSSNSHAIYIYDVTNAAWIQPAGVYNLTQGSGTGKAVATFQTTSNSTQYQIAIININAISGAYSLYLDDISVGPQVLAQGPAMSDWQSYTPTISGGSIGASPSSNLATWRRVGDSMEISYTLNQTNAGSSSGVSYWSLPSGYTIDTNKVILSGGSVSLGVVGTCMVFDGSVPYDGTVIAVTSTLLGLRVLNDVSTSTDVGVSRAPFSGASNRYSFFARVPISGWSSNVVMSQDTDTRVVAARVYKASNQTGINPNNSDVQILFDTPVFDTHASWASNKYTTPVSGFYKVTTLLNFISTNVLSSVYYASIYKNGVAVTYSQGSDPAANSQFGVLASDIIKCNAGDYLQIYMRGSGDNSTNTLTLQGSSVQCYVTIERLSGPAVVATSEVVACDAYLNSNQTGVNPNANAVKINLNTINNDSHGAFDTSNKKYIIPVSGWYQICGQVFLSNSNTLATSYYEALLYKNGSVITYGPSSQAAIAGTFICLAVNSLKYLNAGDYLELYLYGLGNNSSNTLTVIGSSTDTYLQLARIK